MAINSYDIVSTLQALGMMKYWKGKHIILKKQVRHHSADFRNFDVVMLHVICLNHPYRKDRDIDGPET